MTLTAPTTTSMTLVDAAREVLGQAGEPLHVRELTRRMLDQQLWTTTGQTPEASVYSKLFLSIRHHGDASPFVQTAPATFALRAAPAAQVVNAASEDELVEEPSEPTPVTSRTFTDAAEAVLRAFGNGQAMHYREITDIARREGLLVTSGRTPEATMSAQIFVENDRRGKRGEALRFKREPGGLVRLTEGAEAGTAGESLDPAQVKVRDELLARIRAMEPKHFELLVGRLLARMGYVEVENTTYGNDAGVDLRAELATGLILPLRIAVQVKRHARNIRRPDVQNLRGSLHVHERGLFVTSGGFSKGAREEALRDSAAPIALLGGKELVRLLVEHSVGVTEVNGTFVVQADLLADGS